MPVKWSINHKDGIVLASAEGEASLQDVEHYIAAMAAAGGLPYRKLFDVTYVAPGALRLAELKALSAKVLALAKDGPIGPLAIVVSSELEQEMAEVFGQADPGRPLAIFSSVAAARDWLDQRATQIPHIAHELSEPV